MMGTRGQRGLLLIAVLLAVPIVPFLFFHEALDRWLAEVLAARPQPAVVFAVVVGLLSTDLLLPVPSSLVSTLAGSQLGPWWATIASWLGMNAGATIGWYAGYRWGRPLAERLATPRDLIHWESSVRSYAATALVLTRALPILAEATVLLVGVQRLPWRQFWPPVVLSNLGIAVAYAWLGSVSAANEWLPAALGISVALPLLVALLVRSRYPG